MNGAVVVGETWDCPPTLDDRQVMDFCRRGYVMLEGVVPEEVNRRTVEFLDEHDSPEPSEILEEDWFDEGVIRNPEAAGAVRSLLGRDFVLPALMANHRVECPAPALNWHQDGTGNWGLSISPVVTIWTGLDATSVANGCLQIVPGSHKSMINSNHDQLYPEQIPVHAPDDKRLHLELEKGEVVLLHNWTLHRSEPNTTDRPRRAFSVCYVDADTVHNETGKTWPQVFPEYVPLAAEVAA